MLSPHHSSSPPKVTIHQQVWQYLGQGAERYIAQSHIDMMLAMTQYNAQDAARMALGYILQTLDLTTKSQSQHNGDYQHELEYYRQQLKNIR